jgi:hypothetical protein
MLSMILVFLYGGQLDYTFPEARSNPFQIA